MRRCRSAISTSRRAGTRWRLRPAHAAQVQHATYMQHTCNIYATYMQHTCNIYATYMQRCFLWNRWRLRLAHAAQVQSTRNMYATCMQHACSMQHATCNMQHATCSMLISETRSRKRLAHTAQVQHARCSTYAAHMQHATCDVRHATCDMRRATCDRCAAAGERPDGERAGAGSRARPEQEAARRLAWRRSESRCAGAARGPQPGTTCRRATCDVPCRMLHVCWCMSSTLCRCTAGRWTVAKTDRIRSTRRRSRARRTMRSASRYTFWRVPCLHVNMPACTMCAYELAGVLACTGAVRRSSPVSAR